MKLHELIKNKLWYLNGATNRTSLSRWSTMIRRIHLAHSFKIAIDNLSKWKTKE
jgi:hypothetical protein